MTTIPGGSAIQTYDLDFTGSDVNEAIGMIVNGGIDEAIQQTASSQILAQQAADTARAAAGNAETYLHRATQAATRAEAAATNAETSVQDSEAWANGTRGGDDVSSSDETYHNNAKYWAGQAAGAVAGVASFNGRSGAVAPASGDYTAAQVGAIADPGSGTTGQVLKKTASGTEWGDAGATIPSTSALLKGDGSGGVSAAVAGTDYATPAQIPTGFAASAITAGTLAGKVQANATAAATLADAQVRDIYIGTAELTNGTSDLAAGSVYLQYDAS